MRTPHDRASGFQAIWCIAALLPFVLGASSGTTAERNGAPAGKGPAVVTAGDGRYTGPTPEEMAKHAAEVATDRSASMPEKGLPYATISRAPLEMTQGELVKLARLAALVSGTYSVQAPRAEEKGGEVETAGYPDPSRTLTPAENAKMREEPSASADPRPARESQQ